jgi:hypothetical protein
MHPSNNVFYHRQHAFHGTQWPGRYQQLHEFSDVEVGGLSGQTLALQIRTTCVP